MNLESSAEIQCPYCGEVFASVVDLSQGSCSYVEDCHVCCRPILFQIEVGDLEREEYKILVTVEN